MLQSRFQERAKGALQEGQKKLEQGQEVLKEGEEKVDKMGGE
jgi:hypothetical protein